MLNWFKSRMARGTARPVRRPEAVKSQGDEHVRAGRYAEAELCYRQVPPSDAHHAGALVALGFVLREQGRPDDAREVLERAVQMTPGDADGHYLLAGVLEAAGPRDTEISHLKKAVELRPDFELARRQLISTLCQSERLAEAVALCEESLGVLPGSAELHYYRGNLHAFAGENDLAIASCRRALALNPAFLAAQQSLSRLLFDTEQLDQAELAYRREIEMTPDHFGPHHQLGLVLYRMARHAEAIELFKRAIALNPHSSASYASLGAAYTDLDDGSEECVALARANFEKAVAVEPQSAELHYSLGLNYWRGGVPDRAMASFDRAIELNPDEVKARWARVMLCAAAFASQHTDDSPSRSRFGRELARFEAWWLKRAADGASFVGDLQPFFLAYQEESNLALLKQYGRICAMAMQLWLDHQKSPAFQRPLAQRIRLGVVSADIRLHSVWMALIKGWIESLDTERFELVVFSLAERSDSETLWARAKSDVLFAGPKNLSQWVAAIREQNCEILLYPAVGLDPMTLKLASLRLAPVQINSWGHPDTSGLPTLDYYVSADCFEPAHAQDHYSENLIVLPHHGNRIRPMALPAVDADFAAMNIDLDRPILVCPGTPFKYQPANDHLFADIALRVPQAQLVLFRASGAALASGAGLGKLLEARITRVFAAAGLQVADHVRFVRWLSFQEFHSLLRRAAVMLDTIGFSGFNTAVQAIECGLPIVTREGKFLRGRLASGVLRRMDLQELIVQTKAEYVNLVVRLVTDSRYAAHIRHEIQQRGAILFDDQAAVGAFQDFLAAVARPRDPSTGAAVPRPTS